MLKNKTALSLSPLALLTLAACGGSTSSGVSVSGKAQNGPLQDAFAFLDLHTVANPNGDGKFNIATELRVPTAADGSFTLTDLGVSDYTLAIETTAATMDTVLNEAYGAGVILKAPEGATMVTPATTMVNAVMVADGVSAAEAMADVAVALGFDAALDINNFDAYKAPTGTAVEIAAAKSIQFAMQVSNNQVMSVVKSFAKAGEATGATAASAYDAALKAVTDVVGAKVAQINAGVASGGTTTLLNFTTDMQDVLDNVTASIVNATGYEAAKSATFDAIAADAKTGLDIAVAQIKTLVEPTGTVLQIAATEAANAKILSAANVVATQIEAAADVIIGGGSLLDAQAKFTIDDADAFTAIANNPAPTGMTLSGSTTVSDVENVTVSEFAGIGFVVGTVTGVDGFTKAGVEVAGGVAADETLTYAIVDGPTVPVFTINATTGVLTLAVQPDYETMGTNKYYDVSVSVTDSGGKSIVETFKVNIGDEPETDTFRISSDTVTWTDFDPSTSTDITNNVMTSTTGSTVTMGFHGTSGSGLPLNLANLVDMFDGSPNNNKTPMLNFSLAEVPVQTGSGTITATIIDVANGTLTNGIREGAENKISITVDVEYVGRADGTATITMPAGDASGSYTGADGAPVTFKLNNGDVDAFSITAGDDVTGMPASLNVKIAALYDAFITGAGSSNLLKEGTYDIAIETDLPLSNSSGVSVTKFVGSIDLTNDTENSVWGTTGDDTIVGTAAAEFIITGPGADTITTGAGDDYIYMAEGMGSTDITKINTVAGHKSDAAGAGFTDTKDKFALDGLTFGELTIAWDAADTGTIVTVKDTGEYLIHITDLAKGYITSADFVSVDIL